MPFLQFKGKIAVENYHHTVPHHTLQFDRGLSVLPDDGEPSLGGNLIVEGDNLLALKALLPTHAGKIKCIYIDPPYNTGNEQWVYNDNLTQPQFKEWIGEVVGKEGEDFLRHDKWCCMMYPRLCLLKELLREDGVIFISIDDHEVANLRLLMDEIFGEENFVATIVWQKRTSPDARTPLGPAHDYVLCYTRNGRSSRLSPLAFDAQSADDFKNPDADARGPWASTDLTGQTGHATPSQYYTIVTPSGSAYPPPDGRCWALSESTFLNLRSQGRIWFGRGGDSRPRLKRFLSEMATTASWTWWTNKEVGHNQEATKELATIMELPGSFTSPKPARLIERIVRLGSTANDIILDSFAGSGTTGQAVMQANREDGGNRTFILVQQPYDTKGDRSAGRNIAQSITRERVRRVIDGYDKPNGEHVDGLGGSFTYASISAEPLFGQYRDLGDRLPDYDEIAKYVYYTETSAEWQPDTADRETGYIGARNGVSYYLLYRPNRQEDWSLDSGFLNGVAVADPNRRLVVYCEKVWVHKDDLRRWQQERHKSIRQMLVPFNLR